jgi:hypothetical protein
VNHAGAEFANLSRGGGSKGLVSGALTKNKPITQSNIRIVGLIGIQVYCKKCKKKFLKRNISKFRKHDVTLILA